MLKISTGLYYLWQKYRQDGILLQRVQLLNLLLLLSLGFFYADIYLDPLFVVVILVSATAIEHFFLYLTKGNIEYFSYSGLISALGIILMVVATQTWIYIVLIFAALGQKHLLKWQGRHLFNPSNFAVMVALLFFFDKAHIVLGQLGNANWMIGLTMVIGSLILVLAQRWLISVGFVTAYLVFQKYIIVASDPTMLFEDIWYRFYSVSFIVFILFMLTDPRTTPRSIKGQVIFGVGIALMSTLLDYIYGFRIQHTFVALFFFSYLTLFGLWTRYTYKEKSIAILLFVVVVAVILYIELQSPYYFEMNRT